MLNRPPDEDRELAMYVVTARERSSPPATVRLFMIAPMRTLVLVLHLRQSAIRRIQVENEAGRPCELFAFNTVYSVMYHAQAWQLYGDAQ